jgi:aryl-alcohol dehydrogenase-like predicted oxidoreductase
MGWGAAKDEARRLYDTFREAGGNFIDTANVYTNGSSEQFVGEFIKDHRQSIVLSTKYSNAMPGNDPNAAGNHRKRVEPSPPANRLHRPLLGAISGTRSPPSRKSCAVLTTSSVKAILYAGISDAPAWWVAQVAQANTLADLRGGSRFVGLQIEYSLIQRTVWQPLSAT